MTDVFNINNSKNPFGRTIAKMVSAEKQLQHNFRETLLISKDVI